MAVRPVPATQLARNALQNLPERHTTLRAKLNEALSIFLGRAHGDVKESVWKLQRIAWRQRHSDEWDESPRVRTEALTWAADLVGASNAALIQSVRNAYLVTGDTESAAALGALEYARAHRDEVDGESFANARDAAQLFLKAYEALKQI